MAVTKIYITKYNFIKPSIPSENEFVSLKQLFQAEPERSLAPKRSFWNEFPYIKWCLLAIPAGFVLALVWTPLLLISGIALFVLLFGMITGTIQSLWYYQKFVRAEHNYYKQLKQTIISSDSYAEFAGKASLI